MQACGPIKDIYKKFGMNEICYQWKEHLFESSILSKIGQVFIRTTSHNFTEVV